MVDKVQNDMLTSNSVYSLSTFSHIFYHKLVALFHNLKVVIKIILHMHKLKAHSKLLYSLHKVPNDRINHIYDYHSLMVSHIFSCINEDFIATCFNELHNKLLSICELYRISLPYIFCCK